MTSTIEVTKPDGSEATIANPLYSYRFHELIEGDFDDKVRISCCLEKLLMISVGFDQRYRPVASDQRSGCSFTTRTVREQLRWPTTQPFQRS